MWELDYKESWVQNWCFWNVVLEKTLENPLDCKGIQPVHPIGIQYWVFIGRVDVEAETPILWPPYVQSWLIWKYLILGKSEGRRRRRWQRMKWLDCVTDSMDISLGKLQDLVMDTKSWHAAVRGSQRVGQDWVIELNWTELNHPWSMPHKRLTQACLWVSQSFQWRHGLVVPIAVLGALNVVVLAWDLLKEVAVFFKTSTIVWPQVNNSKWRQPHPSKENWIKVLLIMAPPIRTRFRT